MTAEAALRRIPRTAIRSDAWWFLPAVPLLAGAIAFAWTLHAELQRLYGLTGSAWDFAYDRQVIWNISQGQGFYSSFARANFLGIHFELIFVVLAAVEKLWPSPAVLLIFSSAGIAATAPAAYLFFRAILPADRAETPWLAVALSVPIPFWAAVQEAARDFFHPENMALAFALLAAWAGIRGHRVAMWCLCLLTLSCKEDQVYTIGVVALLLRVYGAPQVKKHWRFILYMAGGWFLIGTGMAQQHSRRGGYTDFVSSRGLVGLAPTLPLSPLTVLEALFRPYAVLVVAAIIAGTCLMPLFAPRWLLLAVPPYLANVLSGHTPQNILHLHYVLLLLFPMIVACAVGAAKYLKTHSLKPAKALAAMLPALILGFAMGRFPPALESDGSLYAHPDTVGQVRAATRIIPADAPVDADDGLTVWLPNRHTINDFPDRLSYDAYVVIDRGGDLSRPTSPTTPRNIPQALSNSRQPVLSAV